MRVAEGCIFYCSVAAGGVCPSKAKAETVAMKSSWSI